MWNEGGGNQQQGQGGFGDHGGGYMNSPGNFGTQPQSQDKKRQQRAQSIQSCTMTQIMMAEQKDEKFIINNNVELHQVTLVGIVRAVKEAPTRLDYEIDDMSGPPIEVRQFVDNDENSPEEERTTAMRENTYVRIYGHVRSFGGKRNVVAFKIVPVTDMNELTCHILEVIHNGLSLSKTSGGTQNPSFNAESNMQTSYPGATGDSMQGLKPMQRQVHMCIQSCTSDQGISLAEIHQQLRGAPTQEIRDAVEFLSTEGHIYSTIDDEHFKSTDMG